MTSEIWRRSLGYHAAGEDIWYIIFYLRCAVVQFVNYHKVDKVA